MTAHSQIRRQACAANKLGASTAPRMCEQDHSPEISAKQDAAAKAVGVSDFNRLLHTSSMQECAIAVLQNPPIVPVESSSVVAQVERLAREGHVNVFSKTLA